MKKIYIFIIILLTTISIISCDININDIPKSEDLKNIIANDETNTSISIETINGFWYLHINYKIPQENHNIPMNAGSVVTFNNMEEFKEKLTNLSFDDNEIKTIQNFPSDKNGIIICDPDTLFELKNLPDKDEYIQNFVEWTGGNNYIIDYQSKNKMGFSVKIANNDSLQKYMVNILAGIGTYEELQKNELIKNLTHKTEKTKMGEKEISYYNTELVKNLKSTYIEFIKNDINYIIYEAYLPDDKLSYSYIFVFDNNNPYMIINHGNILSYEEIESLKLNYVK